MQLDNHFRSKVFAEYARIIFYHNATVQQSVFSCTQNKLVFFFFCRKNRSFFTPSNCTYIVQPVHTELCHTKSGLWINNYDYLWNKYKIINKNVFFFFWKQKHLLLLALKTSRYTVDSLMHCVCRI